MYQKGTLFPEQEVNFLCIFDFFVGWMLSVTLCNHTCIGGSHFFSVVNKDEKVPDVLWSCVCMY